MKDSWKDFGTHSILIGKLCWYTSKTCIYLHIMNSKQDHSRFQLYTLSLHHNHPLRTILCRHSSIRSKVSDLLLNTKGLELEKIKESPKISCMVTPIMYLNSFICSRSFFFLLLSSFPPLLSSPRSSLPLPASCLSSKAWLPPLLQVTTLMNKVKKVLGIYRVKRLRKKVAVIH